MSAGTATRTSRSGFGGSLRLRPSTGMTPFSTWAAAREASLRPSAPRREALRGGGGEVADAPVVEEGRASAAAEAEEAVDQELLPRYELWEAEAADGLESLRAGGGAPPPRRHTLIVAVRN